MTTRVLLVAADRQAREGYLQAVAESEIACETLESLEGLRRTLEKTAFNGLLLDLPTLVRSDAAAKKLVSKVQDIYPTVRLRWLPERQQVRAIVAGGQLDPGAPLTDFIDRYCRPWRARPLRQAQRMTTYFSVLLSNRPDFPPEATEKTNTLDLSEGGCFIISSSPWEVGSRAWVRIMELDDDTPMEVEVRMHRPWGAGKKLPGLGVAFLNLLPGQRMRVEALLGGKGLGQRK
ncbi:MAG: hypothetical protein C0617_14795 [Desulfuromonas sp.]|uniref:PilZ domain-containing protein n=1 Tax=Desulfuromonas sp. TaxID=892 RepID=UPI000CBD92BB|nr:PilZ domain-containing protein [Desulfuromonas sp.]PLX82377.1 MAG: hypothetical protein C0617_14795 [Desulfuromonas sp.]